MRLILITPPTTAPSEVRTVNRLFEAGLPLLHVRKPSDDAAALRTYLLQIAPEHRQRLVLHQHHQLAQELGLKVRAGMSVCVCVFVCVCVCCSVRRAVCVLQH
jgi:thiamine-phosphate pyrophosphorylase